jgi:hypothetical protein
LKQFSNASDWFDKRDEIKKVLAAHLLKEVGWLLVSNFRKSRYLVCTCIKL